MGKVMNSYPISGRVDDGQGTYLSAPVLRWMNGDFSRSSNASALYRPDTASVA
jgi:hypothetical protein